MGANEHERIVPLWREAPRWSTQERPGGPWVQHTGRRKRLTVEEAWRDVADAEGYEDGHSYSGNFGSKHGMVVVARNEKLDRYMDAAGRMVAYFDHEDYEWSEDPRVVKRLHINCGECWGRGTVRSVVTQNTIPCPACKGKGKRGRNAEESAEARKRANACKKVVELIGEPTLRRAAQIYDDKWGPAAAIVGKDLVWFGGYCSS